jgi:stage V sporulation protein G
MKVTGVRIRPANEEFVKAYASICFDDCLVVYDIKVIQGPTGLFLSFPNRKLNDGTRWDIAFPANAETRMMIQQVVLAEYEKWIRDISE